MSALVDLFLFQCKAIGLPSPTLEHRFHPDRKWRLDVSWPDQKFAVEVEGGTWVNGRHSRGAGFEKDCEKYAEAIALGWRLLRVTGGMVRSGKAVEYAQRILRGE